MSSENSMCMCDRHAGVLFGISNTVATIPGMLAPTVAGLLTPNVSYLLMLSLHAKYCLVKILQQDGIHEFTHYHIW